MGLLVLFSILILPLSGSLVTSPPDEGYQSENTHQGVRPSKQLPVLQEKKKDDKKEDRKPDDDKVINADDIEKLKKLDGKEITVTGKVHEAYIPKSKNAVMLNLGPDFKKCFKAVIYSSNWSKWDKGIDGIKALEGKTVQVSGKITIYNDLPEIKVNVPSQIKTK